MKGLGVLYHLVLSQSQPQAPSSVVTSDQTSELARSDGTMQL